MKDYSIIYEGIDEMKQKFYYTINGNKEKKVILKVYNQYLKWLEFEDILTLIPGLKYWTYVPTNSKNRYVEFIDVETLEIVGMFGLDGIQDMEEVDYNGYVKKLCEESNNMDKNSIGLIFNEIVCMNTYNNDFVSVKENDLVIDIGFNHGLFTYESLSKNPLKVIGFEPNPKLVQSWILNNNDKRVVLNQLAVSDRTGVATFYESNMNGMSSIYKDINNSSKHSSYDVNVIGFYDYLSNNNIKKIDYLKVDCEGAEYDIFKSIPDEYLKNNISKIAIEFHHVFSDEKVQFLLNRIKNCGFETKVKYEEKSYIGMIYAKK
jgi:FkbM family methyltransferase